MLLRQVLLTSVATGVTSMTPRYAARISKNRFDPCRFEIYGHYSVQERSSEFLHISAVNLKLQDGSCLPSK